MTDDANQVLVPASFTALFVPPGRLRPTASRDVIAARHDFCEDLAQMLVEPALLQLHGLQHGQQDVLERVRAGLVDAGSQTAAALEAPEADWVLHRLAELLNWPQPQPQPQPSGPPSDA